MLNDSDALFWNHKTCSQIFGNSLFVIASKPIYMETLKIYASSFLSFTATHEKPEAGSGPLHKEVEWVARKNIKYISFAKISSLLGSNSNRWPRMSPDCLYLEYCYPWKWWLTAWCRGFGEGWASHFNTNLGPDMDHHNNFCKILQNVSRRKVLGIS